MNANFYVYEHIRPDTNAVFYVGKGHGRRSRTVCGRNKHWRNIVAKADGFSVRMVAENVDEELAFLIECERIDQLRRLGVNLCNMTDGGEGASGRIYLVSEETRRRLSDSHKDFIMPEETKHKISVAHKGRPKSEDTRRKMSEACSGEKNHMFGRTHTEEMKRRISESLVGRRSPMLGRTHSNETKQKLTESHSGRKNRLSIATAFDGKIFECSKALAEYTGIAPRTIRWRLNHNPAKWGYEILGRTKDVLKDTK